MGLNLEQLTELVESEKLRERFKAMTNTKESLTSNVNRYERTLLKFNSNFILMDIQI